MDDPTGKDKPAKRFDVGYKRPPAEHRFRKGQPRPARRKKEVPANVPMTRILREVLHEPRRVLIHGKIKWVSGAELVIRQAYVKAEAGNAMLRRVLAELLLGLDGSPREEGLRVVTDPSAPADATALQRVTIDPDGEDCQ